MEKREGDITYQKAEDENSRKEENSYSVINTDALPQESQENLFYEEADRKFSLRKLSARSSKIILHRKRTSYKGRKVFDISTAILGVIGIILLIIFIIICARRGWSKSNIYDVSSGNKIGKYYYIY